MTITEAILKPDLFASVNEDIQGLSSPEAMQGSRGLISREPAWKEKSRKVREKIKEKSRTTRPFQKEPMM